MRTLLLCVVLSSCFVPPDDRAQEVNNDAGSLTTRLDAGFDLAPIADGGLDLGSDGGIARLAQGLLLFVPPGAMSTPTHFSAVASSSLPSTSEVGSQWKLGPEGVSFSAPVLVRMAIAQPVKSRVFIATRDTETSPWRELPSRTFPGGVEAETTHFSYFVPMQEHLPTSCRPSTINDGGLFGCSQAYVWTSAMLSGPRDANDAGTLVETFGAGLQCGALFSGLVCRPGGTCVCDAPYYRQVTFPAPPLPLDGGAYDFVRSLFECECGAGRVDTVGLTPAVNVTPDLWYWQPTGELTANGLSCRSGAFYEGRCVPLCPDRTCPAGLHCVSTNAYAQSWASLVCQP